MSVVKLLNVLNICRVWTGKPSTFLIRQGNSLPLIPGVIPKCGSLWFYWAFLGYAFSHVLRSTLQGYILIDRRPLTVI
jgi:hypothetical protein